MWRNGEVAAAEAASEAAWEAAWAAERDEQCADMLRVLDEEE